jgi:hypothetical protein
LKSGRAAPQFVRYEAPIEGPPASGKNRPSMLFLSRFVLKYSDCMLSSAVEMRAYPYRFLEGFE